MSQLLSIQITTPNEKTTRELGEELVKLQLVACAQIEGPITSIYRWKEKIEEESEWRLTLKTDQSHFFQIEAFIVSNHPYEVPQIICLPITVSHDPYESWVRDQLS